MEGSGRIIRRVLPNVGDSPWSMGLFYTIDVRLGLHTLIPTSLMPYGYYDNLS